MKKIIVLSMCILCLIMTSCSNQTIEPTAMDGAITDNGEDIAIQGFFDVSIIELISNPSDYDGKPIRVIGVGNLEFEGDAIYLSKDDWKYNIFQNGLWIDLGAISISYEEAVSFNGKFVIIEGVFDKDDKGHLSAWPGTIKEISRYQLWER